MQFSNSFMTQFARFLLSGVAVVGLNFLIYSLLLHIHFNYLLANAIAFVLAGLMEFQINKRWVFKLQQHHKPSLTKFLVINLVMLGVSSFVLAMVIESNIILNSFPNLSDFQIQLLAKIPALIAVALLDFTMKRFFVFNPNNIKLRDTQ